MAHGLELERRITPAKYVHMQSKINSTS
jgi:hypothetical protein